MRFLLDEDVNPAAAGIARGRGLDVVSVHEVDRRGLGDADQLRYAAMQRRAFVTRNRDDFRQLTVEFFEARELHAGVLILPFSVRNDRPGAIAAALRRYQGQAPGEHMQPYTLDFLGAADD